MSLKESAIESQQAERAQAKPKGRLRGLWIALAVVAALLAIGWVSLTIYANGYARAGETAATVAAAQANRIDDALLFGSGETGVILYPGGLVDEAAYAPLASRLARDGVFVVVPSMPYHLAVFGMNRAEKIIAKYDEVSRWYIGGHSLGGAMAASYASAHADKIDGVILLAAYSTEPLDLPVLSIYGDRDTVLNAEKYAAYRENLPEDCVETIITGGNHAQFGDYGAQEGDSPASITAEQQQENAAKAIRDWIDEPS